MLNAKVVFGFQLQERAVELGGGEGSHNSHSAVETCLLESLLKRPVVEQNLSPAFQGLVNFFKLLVLRPRFLDQITEAAPHYQQRVSVAVAMFPE
jgi:hypothetical protein